MSQRTTEWLEATSQGQLEDYRRQYQEPYDSTLAFHRFLKDRSLLHGRIADVCCGLGAPTYFFAQQEPQVQFEGLDFNPLLIEQAGSYVKDAKNLSLRVADLYNLDPLLQGRYDGVMSLQSISWLPDFETPIRALASLNPGWIALTSLFYDGPVSARIEIRDYSTPVEPHPYKEVFYNAYGLPLVGKLFAELGFSNFEYEAFEIARDLPRPEIRGMGTYTEKLEDGRRLQLSGPLLMNWYFVLAKRA